MILLQSHQNHVKYDYIKSGLIFFHDSKQRENGYHESSIDRLWKSI